MILKLNDKYIIKFNTQYIPDNFNKWIKLDINEDDKNKQLKLNKYKSVLIKSKEKNILLQLGGINFIINENSLHIPYFPFYQYCFITLSINIDIYIIPNDESNECDDISKLLIDKSLIFSNLKIIDDEKKPIPSEHYLFLTDGMIGLTSKKYIDINIEKFYYEYEKENINDNIEQHIINNNINLIDKYYQNNAIKICKFI